MGYRYLTTLILGLHFAYLLYLVAGGFLAWRWPRAIWPHLAAGVWGFAVIAGRLVCPLTYAEDWSRRQAGEAGLTQGFIDRYVEGVIYPQQYTHVAQALTAVIVLVSWAGYLVRRKKIRASLKSLEQLGGRPDHHGEAMGAAPPRRRTAHRS
ncbi:DUF2784 domain-containing protein [Phytohabitans aurantiacus]|nr:DUF2784 domain-containing protein [Phytohabitans aurantiacus]